MIPVLLYHRIGSSQGATSIETFTSHLNWLMEHGYYCLSLSEFKQRLSQKNQQTGKKREVLITFDDGFSEIFDNVFPILKKFNVNATVFLITDRVGKKGYMDWPSVCSLQDSGQFEIHSHSHQHIHWQSLEEIRADLIESKALLAKHLKKPETCFDVLAWPWGACNPQWESLASDVGFSTQFLVQTAAIVQGWGSLKLPRICCDSMPLWRFVYLLRSLSLKINKVPYLNYASIAYRKIRRGFGYIPSKNTMPTQLLRTSQNTKISWVDKI